MAESQTQIETDLLITHKSDGYQYFAIQENKEAGSVLMQCSKCEDLVVVTHMNALAEPETPNEPASGQAVTFVPLSESEAQTLESLSTQTQSPQENPQPEAPSDSAIASKGKRRRSG